MTMALTFWRRVWFLARVGAIGGSVFAGWVCILALLSRSMWLPVRGDPVWVPAIIGAYLIGGLGAGVVTGLLFPLLTTVIGSVIVGVVASAPFAAATITVLSGFSWDQND